MEIGVTEFRLQGDRLIKARERLVETIELSQDISAIEVGLGEVRLQRDGLVMTC